MPRAGLDATAIVSAAANLADEIGFAELTMAQLAVRLGVKAPSLYKHLAGQEDLNRRIAALALTEGARAVGTAIQGRSGRDALGAAARALRAYVLEHPGRYAATTSIKPTGPDDPVAVAADQGIAPFAAILRGYDIPPSEMTHALRSLRSAFHGFALLQATSGFQRAVDVDESFEWLVDLMDRGLRAHAPGR